MRLKKIMFLGFLILACFGAVNAFAYDSLPAEDESYAIESDEISYDRTPINKLGRGVVNAATCWAEVPATVFAVSKKHDPVIGLTLGVVEGTFTTLLRGLTGLYDTVTFVVPPYDRPLMQPEYALRHADEKMQEYLW